MTRLAALTLAILAFPVLGWANGDKGVAFPPSIVADVVSVYDGDTLTVNAYPRPQMTIRTSVRVKGIDTPEINGQCEAEKQRANLARDVAKEMVGERVILQNIELDKRIVLQNVQLGKYAGRVVADVILEDGRSLADILITADLARPYDGGTREGWCEDDGG